MTESKKAQLVTARRQFNQTALGLGASALAGIASAPFAQLAVCQTEKPLRVKPASGVRTSRANQPHDPHPRKPKRELPTGACDAHVHLLGPFDRYPLVASSSLSGRLCWICFANPNFG